MGKEDTVSTQLQSVQTAETQALTDALGACYDQGALDQKASDGTLTQADVDAAVKAATDPLNAQIAQDATDLQAAHADADQKLADLQSQLDAMTAAKGADDAVVKGLQDSVAAVQAALDSIKALILPS